MMSEVTRTTTRRSGFFHGLWTVVANLALLACVLIVIAGGIGYALGWVTVTHSDARDKAVVEINTTPVEGAISVGKGMFNATEERLEDAGPESDV